MTNINQVVAQMEASCSLARLARLVRVSKSSKKQDMFEVVFTEHIYMFCKNYLKHILFLAQLWNSVITEEEVANSEIQIFYVYISLIYLISLSRTEEERAIQAACDKKRKKRVSFCKELEKVALCILTLYLALYILLLTPIGKSCSWRHWDPVTTHRQTNRQGRL